MKKKDEITIWWVAHFIVLLIGGNYLAQKGNLVTTVTYCILVIVSWFGGHIQLFKEPQEYDAKLGDQEK